MITDIKNSGYEFVLYLLLVILIYLIYAAIKKIKMKFLIADGQLRNAKTFGFGIETSMAISDEGLIGIINFKFQTVTMHIKDIAEFEILISRYCITNGKPSENKGILFNGVGERLRPILESDKMKDIAFIIKLKSGRILSMNLFKGTMLKNRPTDAYQYKIVQMFELLENVERRCKGKRAANPEPDEAQDKLQE